MRRGNGGGVGKLLPGEELLYLESMDTGGQVNTTPKMVCKPLCISVHLSVCLSVWDTIHSIIMFPRDSLILSI